MEQLKQLLALLSPAVVILVPGATTATLRIIYKFYPHDLDNLLKMAISAVLGGLLGLVLFWYGIDFENVSEAIKIGLLSGVFATTSYGAYVNTKKVDSASFHK